MTYFIEFPKEFSDDYLNEINITDFVNSFKKYKKITLNCDQGSRFNRWVRETFYKNEKFDYTIRNVIDFIDCSKFLCSDKYLKKFNDVYDKYKPLLIQYLDKKLNENNFEIIRIEDIEMQKKFQIFFNILNGSVVCYQTKMEKVPFWINFFPYILESDKVFFLQQADDSNFNNYIKCLQNENSITSFKIKNNIVLLKDCIHFVVIGISDSMISFP